MLTDLQRRVTEIVLRSDLDPHLALAGAGALIARGIVDRTTADIDLFTVEPYVDALVDRLEPVFADEGLTVERVRVAPTFARLTVSDAKESCRLDIAQDTRLLPVERGPLGPTVARDELAADKVLALFGRAEPRDYVDVLALADRHGRERLLELAAQKDLGFDRRVFAEMLGGLERLERDEFEVDDETFERLRRFVEDWRRELSAERS